MLASRRDFLRRGVAGAAGVLVVGAPAAWRWGQGGRPLKPSSLTGRWPRAVRYRIPGGGDFLLIVGNGGSVLVDCKNVPFGAALSRGGGAGGEDRAGDQYPSPRRPHGGNHAFTADLKVIAHEKAKRRIAPQMNRYIPQAKEAVLSLPASEKPGAVRVREDARAYHDRMGDLKAPEFEPTQTVGDSEELEVGGVKIGLRHFLALGHTDNDLVVHFPGRNVVHCGDLLFHKLHPFIDRSAGATTAGWIGSLRKIIELCDDTTVVVPGHGELTDVAGVRGQIEYFERCREAVAAAIKEGKDKKAVQAWSCRCSRGTGGRRGGRCRWGRSTTS